MELPLTEAVSRGNPASVARMYRMNPAALRASLTGPGPSVLHIAATKGHVEVVTLLLLYGAMACDNRAVHGATAAAIKHQKHRSSAVLKLFMGPMVVIDDEFDPSSKFSILEAAERGLGTEVDRLASVKSSSMPKSKDGWTVLMWMSLYSTVRVVKTILETLGTGAIGEVNAVGANAVHAAAMGGSVEVLLALLESDKGKAAAVVPDAFMNTPLHYAVYGGHTEVVKVLLPLTFVKEGLVEVRNVFNHSLLHIAAALGNVAMVDLLAASAPLYPFEAALNSVDLVENTPLHCACMLPGTSVALVERLLAFRANVNSVTTGGWSPLMQAIVSCEVSTVELLLMADAPLSGSTKDGWTACHWAAYVNAANIAALLVEKGVSLLAKTNEDYTALDIARSHEHNDVVAVLEWPTNQETIRLDPERHAARLLKSVEKSALEDVASLLAFGVSPCAAAPDGTTPVYTACVNNLVGPLQLLLRVGGPLNTQHPSNGHTPFFAAALAGNVTCLKLLMGTCASPEIPNNTGDKIVQFLSGAIRRDVVDYTEALKRKFGGEELAPSGDQLRLAAAEHHCHRGGEALLVAVESCIYIPPQRGGSAQPGVLFVTSFELVFKSYTQLAGLTLLDDSYSPAPVALGSIERVDKVGGMNSRGENAYGLEVTTKDNRRLRFSFLAHDNNRRAPYTAITEHAFGGQLALFAFTNTTAYLSQGWSLYSEETEFARQGIALGQPACPWRLSLANARYELCDSYPARIVVPATVTDEALAAVAAFRSKGRLPALSWVHPTNGASISRCSQPKTGLGGNKSVEDEELIKAFMETSAEVKDTLHILDARPKANAYANTAKGLGFENISRYKGCSITFWNIGNIHVMRDSLGKVYELCSLSSSAMMDSTLKWKENIHATKWLQHIRLVLLASEKVVRHVADDGISVVVHCSDGWDRTAQMCAIAETLLDPYYRTIEGFAVLIEKDWLSFGHKMAQRLGHGDDKATDEQRAPIFLQYIDCIYQLLVQFPTAFEFNDTLLIHTLDSLFSCEFGTFLFNNERERVEANLKGLTPSFWSHVLDHKSIYLNDVYKADGERVLRVDVERLSLWQKYYCRWNTGVVSVLGLAEATVLSGADLEPDTEQQRASDDEGDGGAGPSSGAATKGGRGATSGTGTSPPNDD